MPSLNRTVNGLLLREDFTAANGWTAGTGFSRVTDPSLVTWGKVSTTAMLVPRANGQPDYDGVREGQLYVEGYGTTSEMWYLLYDAGDDTTGWRQFIATSTDRGLTWSRAVQTIQLDNGSAGSYAAVATGWIEKRSGTYDMNRVTTDTVFGSPNTGLPNLPFDWDVWHCSSINGTYVFDRKIDHAAGGTPTWADHAVQPGSTVLDSGTYYQFVSGNSATAVTVGYLTASAAVGPWTYNASSSVGAFAGPHSPENPKLFYHSQLASWVMLVNLIDPSGNFAGRNGVVVSSSLTDWSSAAKFMTQRYQAVCDTSGNAIGVQTHVTGPDGALIQEGGFVPMVYDADPRASSPGWHRGRSIFVSVLEPAAARLHYSDATTTRHRYNKTFSHTDFIAEFEVDTAAIVTGSDVSFEFRTDGTSGYRIMVRNESGGTLRLEKMDGTTIQNGTGTALTSGVFLRIKISAVGTALKAWMDGEKQIDTTDSTYASGTEIAFSGKDCTADVRLLHLRTSDVLTIRGLPLNQSINIRSFSGMPVSQVTSDGSGIATYIGTHFPISRIDVSTEPGGDAQTPDMLLWGGDDVRMAGLGWLRE